jgi:hypothetical protein
VAIPALIRTKAQFYCAVAFVAAAILIAPFANWRFIAFIVAILQVMAFVALVLCAGGLELHEFADHMVNAYDAFRYGEHPGPVIVPRTEPTNKEPPINPVDLSSVPPTPVKETVHESIPVEPPPAQAGEAPLL